MIGSMSIFDGDLEANKVRRFRLIGESFNPMTTHKLYLCTAKFGAKLESLDS